MSNGIELFEMLDAALDESAYEHLASESPTVAAGIRIAIRAGATPEDVRAYILQRRRSADFARLCEDAARFIATSGE